MHPDAHSHLELALQDRPNHVGGLTSLRAIRKPSHPLTRWVCLLILLLSSAGTVCLGKTTDPFSTDYPISFDVPDAVVVRTVPDEPNHISFDLKISASIHPDHESSIQHWRLLVRPRSNQLRTIDYEPKTETDSEITGPKTVKTTEEKSSSLVYGLKLDVAKIACLTGTSDHSTKDSQSEQYQTKPQKRIKIAAGSVDRGAGVYFKLARTADQILDGERTFQFIIEVPDHWRTGLLDLTIIASGRDKRFDAHSIRWKTTTFEIATEQFAISMYRQGDHFAAERAARLSDKERVLRIHSDQKRKQKQDMHLSTIATGFSKGIVQMLNGGSPQRQWLDRVLHDQASPHTDHDLTSLPMDTRVAILDYIEAREEFLGIETGCNDHY